MRPGRRAARGVGGLLVASLLLAACGGGSPSTLHPVGPQSGLVDQLWWVLFGISVFVCAVVIALTVWAVARRRRAAPTAAGHERFVVVLGFAIPAVILAGMFGFGLRDMAALSQPPTQSRMTIDVVGHQWFWEMRYPGGGITANEMHVPVGEPVRVRLWTDDVIHSFWVPEIMPKQDLLPNRVNEVWMQVDRAGTYRGQCAEYCGLEHANMAFFVIAQPRSEFDSWLADQQQPARTPTTAQQRLGMRVFTTGTCATCHTVRGTSANGRVGPDLTHVGSRRTLAAGTIPNDFGHMSGWVSNSQTIKPGNKMPPQQLSPKELRAVVTYLQSLQ